MNDGEELQRPCASARNMESPSLGIVPLRFYQHQDRFSWSHSDKPELARRTIAMIRAFKTVPSRRFGRHTFQMSDKFILDAGIEPPEADFYDGYPQYYDGIGMIQLVSGQDRQRARRRCRASAPRSLINRRPWPAPAVPLGRQRAIRWHVLWNRRRPSRYRHGHQNRYFGGNVDVTGPHRRKRHPGAAAPKTCRGYALCA